MQPSFYQTGSHIKSLPVVCQVKLLKQATFPRRIHGNHKKHDGHWIIPTQSNIHLKTRTWQQQQSPFFGSNVVIATTNLQWLWHGIQFTQWSTHTPFLKHDSPWWLWILSEDKTKLPDKHSFSHNIQLPAFPLLNRLFVVISSKLVYIFPVKIGHYGLSLQVSAVH